MYSLAKLNGKRYDRCSSERDESKAVTIRPEPISRLYMSKIGEEKEGNPGSPSSEA